MQWTSRKPRVWNEWCLRSKIQGCRRRISMRFRCITASLSWTNRIVRVDKASWWDLETSSTSRLCTTTRLVMLAASLVAPRRQVSSHKLGTIRNSSPVPTELLNEATKARRRAQYLPLHHNLRSTSARIVTYTPRSGTTTLINQCHR